MFERALHEFHFDYLEPARRATLAAFEPERVRERIEETFKLQDTSLAIALNAYKEVSNRLPLIVYRPSELRGFGAVFAIGHIPKALGSRTNNIISMPPLDHDNVIIVQKNDGSLALALAPKELDLTDKAALHSFLLNAPLIATADHDHPLYTSMRFLSVQVNEHTEVALRDVGSAIIEQVASRGQIAEFTPAAFFEALKRIENARMIMAFVKFAGYLDKPAAHQLSEVNTTNIVDYNFLTGGAKPAYRQQALQAYPTMIQVFSGVELDFGDKDGSFRAAIDTGKPISKILPSYLAELCGFPVTPQMVKQSASPQGKALFERFGSRHDILFAVLAAVPEKFLPHEDEFEFHISAFILAEVYKAAQFLKRDPLKALAEIKGDYKKWKPLMRPYVGPSQWLTESLNAFGKRFVAPILAEELQAREMPVTIDTLSPSYQIGQNWTKSVSALYSNPDLEDAFSDTVPLALSVFANKSIFQVLNFASAWQSRINGVEHKLITDELDPTISWPAIIKPMTAPNGVRIEAITTAPALKKLGSTEELDNCIAVYAARCVNGGSHILRLSHRGRTLSAAWLDHYYYDNEAHPDQSYHYFPWQEHEGHKQGAAPRNAQAALDWFKGGIKDGSINANWKKIEKYTKAYQASPDRKKISGVYGGDVFDRQRAQRAFETYLPLLLPLLKDEMTCYETFVEGLDIRKTVQAFLETVSAARPRADRQMDPFSPTPKH